MTSPIFSHALTRHHLNKHSCAVWVWRKSTCLLDKGLLLQISHASRSTMYIFLCCCCCSFLFQKTSINNCTQQCTHYCPNISTFFSFAHTHTPMGRRPCARRPHPPSAGSATGLTYQDLQVEPMPTQKTTPHSGTYLLPLSPYLS